MRVRRLRTSGSATSRRTARNCGTNLALLARTASGLAEALTSPRADCLRPSIRCDIAQPPNSDAVPTMVVTRSSPLVKFSSIGLLRASPQQPLHFLG